ncbi:MAG: DUF559 domain-containing protein [bacterium]|nr:DUF559 domain-containing protein [bacterium]
MFIGSNKPIEIELHKKLVALSRLMRREATEAEQIIWINIRRCQVQGAKFRRQHPFFKFILDFYCHQYKIIIEIDGPYHVYQLERDYRRDSFLKSKGYIVLRFTNDEVITNIDKVLTIIETEIIMLNDKPLS